MLNHQSECATKSQHMHRHTLTSTQTKKDTSVFLINSTVLQLYYGKSMFVYDVFVFKLIHNCGIRSYTYILYKCKVDLS